MEILQGLWDADIRMKGGIHVNFFGIPRDLIDSASFKSTLSQLKQKELIEKEGGLYSISKSGKEYIQNKLVSLKHFNYVFPSNTPHTLLIIFDIPESKRKERDWFRWHLIRFGYKMIQKSVWVGPDPLPKQFNYYLKQIRLDLCIKKFKLAKHYKFKN